MYLAAFLLDFSVAVGLTAMPFFIIDRIHGGAALSGTVGAVQMALYAMGCLVSAGFVSRARNSLHWALAGVSIFGLLFALVPAAGTAAACVFLASVPFLGLALAWPAMQAWLGREPDVAVRARRVAGFNMATAFGFTLSPLVAGPLYDADFRLPFLMLVLLCLIVGILILALIVRPAQSHTETDAVEESTAVPWPPGLLYASWLATFTANGLLAAVRSVYPLRVKALAIDGSLTLVGNARPDFLDAVGPATTFSWLAFLLSLCTVLCFAVMGRTRGWQGRFSILAAAQALAGISFVALGHTRSLLVMAACFAIVGGSFGVCFFASLFYSLADAKERHKRAAINEGLLGAGGFAGGIGLGYAAEWFRMGEAFQWTFLAVIFAIALQSVVRNVAFSTAPK